jgi:4-phospho-D-threonate 3-dehydrogenase / 4-phospho-D-erythronate 3-dehydrogenase
LQKTFYVLQKENIIIGFSVGDINGIGLETFLKLFENPEMFKYCVPVLYANRSVVDFCVEQNQFTNVNLHTIQDTKDCKSDCINLKTIDAPELTMQPGESSTEAGKFAVASLLAAVEDVKNGQIINLVTLPLNKHNIQSEEFTFPGHTSYLAEAFDSEHYMMLLVSDELKVGVVTDHIPVQDISKHLTQDLITQKINTLHESLEIDFGIRKPKIAVLGLNPHSGDNGLIGSEEADVIQPAILEQIESGRTVFGPYSADGFFGNKLYLQFDAVLAMYHDQGLIPFKQIAFEKGVNYTAGLPIIRTSPDHGTAYDIAGKNTASFTSLMNAIFLNNRLYHQRIENLDLHKNKLAFKSHRRERFSIGVPNLK